MNDLKYSWRSLLKRPGLSFVAIITLALGMGAATAIFSVVDAVLLRPPPYPNPERLVEIRELDERGRGMPVCEPNYVDLAARNHSFEAVARHAIWTQAVAGGREPQRLDAAPVSGDFFRVLGVQPLRGRFFSGTNIGNVAVVSYSFWKRQLGGSEDLEGKTLRFANRNFIVIGVMPPGTEYPTGVELWYPAEIHPANTSRSGHNWRVVARLKPGATPDQARADIATIGHQLKQEYGREIDAVSFAALPLRERSVQDVRRILFVLCGAVGVLLLIAASNVGNLLFVRATVRRKEMALRIALGASSGQLAKQFIIEALLLTGIAAALGTLFAIWGVDLIVGLYHATLPQVGKIGINLNVLFFSFCVAIILGVGLGLALTVHISGEQLQQDLQEAGHRATAGRRNRRIRNGLIIAQVALSLLLLVGAGLLGRSFQQLLAVDPGFSAQSVVAMTISLPEAEGDASRRKLAQFCHQLLVRLQNIPGVSNVGGIDALPMSGDGSNGRFIIEEGGVTVGSMDEFSRKMTALLGTNRIGDAQHRVTTGGYFEAMHIPVLRGRTFEESDGPNNPHVAVISESLARRYFPNADPLGKQIQFGNMDGDLHLLNIVGLVGDVRDKTFEATPQPTVYVNYLQRGSLSDFSFVVRARIEAKALIGVMRRETQAANPEMPIKFETLEQLVASSLDNRRFGMVMVGEFAGTALILAMVGLYGLMAYITTERTTEIGIRMALGAQRRNVLQLILRHALFLFATGTFTGVLLALATTWLLRSFLYGVGPIDLVTYSAVVFLSGITASIATYFPARRAMAVDPMIALRQQ